MVHACHVCMKYILVRRRRVKGYVACLASFWEIVEISLWIRKSFLSVRSGEFHASRFNCACLFDFQVMNSKITIMMMMIILIKQKGHENKGNDHQLKNPWLFNKFSLSNPLEIYREQYEGNGYCPHVYLHSKIIWNCTLWLKL